MEVKIDTKERFEVITIEEPILSANIAAELTQLVKKTLAKEVKNLVLKLPATTTIEGDAAKQLLFLQESFYKNMPLL